MSVDQRAVIAANNNADLYEAMFSSQGLRFKRLPLGTDHPPPYYSNLTVLSPNHADDIVLQIKSLATKFNGKIGVKDSFCRLNLGANGFDTLFKASWIWREATSQTTPCDWQRVEDKTDLLLWEKAWKRSGAATQQRMFNVKMLERPEISFFGRKIRCEFESGCVANESANCIGISNVFAKSSPVLVFAQATAAVASIDPHKPIVGYESGRDLEHVRKTGFSTIGDLHILIAKVVTF